MVAVLAGPGSPPRTGRAETAAQGRYCRPRVLCNPLSGRCRKHLGALRRLATALPGAEYAEASTPTAVEAAVMRFDAEACDLLVIVGGDGTLGLVMTALLGNGLRVPAIAVIPAGTANTLALDLGVKGGPEEALSRFGATLSASDTPTPLLRSVIKVEHGNGPPRFGMVFGLGAVAAVVGRFGTRGNRLRLTGELGSLGAFVGAMAAAVTGRYRGPLAPVSMTVRVDDGPTMDGEYLVILASGLERMLLGFHPYWGGENAPLHYTAIAHPPKSLGRVLPSLLRGGGHPRLHPDNGYHSANASRLEFVLDGTFMLDGEIYPVSRSDGPLCASAQAPIAFLRA